VDIRSITSGAALRVALIVFGVLIALRFLWLAHAIFIVTFLGILLGLAVARAADGLERIHVKRAFGAPLVVFAGIGLLIALGAMLAPSLRNQVTQLATELPKLVDKADRWLQNTPAKSLVQPEQQAKPQQQSQQQQQQHGGLRDQLARELRGSLRFFFPIVSSGIGAIGGLVLVLFIAMYIAVEPGLYREGVLHLIPHNHRERAEELVATLGTTLRQWLIARLIAMVVIGVITGTALALLKVKGAGALGVLAGLLEFIPFFGPIGSAIPAIGVALLDSPQKALYVVILYIVLQQLEGNVLTPLLLEKRLDIPPVLTVVTVAALGVVFGVIGMLIAEPLLAAVLVTTKMLYVTDVVGDEVKVGKKE
jgi:predicted PurR-regulated permease PerM